MGVDERLSPALAAASRAYKAAAAAEMGALGVHPGQNFLLDALRGWGPMPTGELARRLHVEVPTVTRMTQRMEVAGLVRRQPDPSDGRRVVVTLTETGAVTADRLPQLLERLSQRALSGLSPRDREHLIVSLERIASNLGWDASSD